MPMTFWITTRDPQRLNRWKHIFGLDRLPVKTAAARLQTTRDGDIFAYDLDPGRLTETQMFRLAADISRKNRRMAYADALHMVKTGQIVIPAQGTRQVTEDEEVTATAERPSLLDRIVGFFSVSDTQLSRAGEGFA